MELSPLSHAEIKFGVTAPQSEKLFRANADRVHLIVNWRLVGSWNHFIKNIACCIEFLGIDENKTFIGYRCKFTLLNELTSHKKILP